MEASKPLKQGTIAVLLTCHNRRDLTLACLRDIYEQQLSSYSVEVFLVDDGSSDGTSQAVRARYPHVNVIKGNGDLFWGGGMRAAYEAASEKGYDFYLWLNDDVTLQPSAFQRVLGTYWDLRTALGREVLVVGVFVEPASDRVSYGGYRKASKWWPTRFERLELSAKAEKCGAANGNCLLIPDSAAASLGNIDSRFVHRIGDFDYTLRANQIGVSVYTVSGSIGECRQNPLLKDQVAAMDGLRQRWQHYTSDKGLPIDQWLLFTQRHAGFLWPLVFTFPYLKFWLKAAGALLWPWRKPGHA